MEKNIFEGAYFGKPYKTRDGRKAIYIEYDKALCKHAFVPDKDTRFTYCFDDGTVWEFETCVDIVSEWQEPIDEEEIDAIVTKLCVENFIDSVDWKDIVCNLTYDLAQAAIEAYEIGCKAGYRNALMK